MNALTLQRPAGLPAPVAHPEPVGEVVAVWSAAPNVLLVLGWQTDRPPAEGVAQLERRRTDAGPFRCAIWRREGGTAHAFVAAVRLPVGTEPRPGQRLALREADRPPLVAVLPETFADLAAFTAGAARLLGAHLGDLVRFLLDAFPAHVTNDVPGIPHLLAAVLARAAIDDGCIELAGGIAGDCAFLQGWGRATEGPAQAVLVCTDATVLQAPVETASFLREDIAPPASGLVSVLPPEITASLARLDALYLISAGAIQRRPVLDRRVLNAADSQGHLRDMLGVLQSSTTVLEALRAALQPRYEGRATLAELGAPVRAMIDAALWHPSAGVYVSGWLFDPTDRVAAVSLVDGSRAAERLDPRWTRVPRPDVSVAFAADAVLPAPAGDDHGFVAYIAAPLAQERLHLTIELATGERGFVPVAARALLGPGGAATALASVDLYKPSGLAIIETQLAPFIAAALRHEPEAALRPTPAAAARGTDERLAIVAALPGPPALPRALLSQFLRAPLQPNEELLLVAGPAWDRASLDRLEAQARALRVPARIIAASEPIDEPGEVVRIAAGQSSADHLLLVSAGVIGRTPGWRQALVAAARLSLVPAAVCPTVLYEDFSIRYAGPTRLNVLRAAPYLRVVRELAGLPAAFAGGGLPAPTVLGTLACCLLTRQAAQAVAHAGPSALSPLGRETAFFLRLHAAGIACVWAPSVQVFSPETDMQPAGAVAGDAAALVDLWSLRAALDGAVLRPIEG